jgi:hypothetical protein
VITVEVYIAGPPGLLLMFIRVSVIAIKKIGDSIVVAIGNVNILICADLAKRWAMEKREGLVREMAALLALACGTRDASPIEFYNF